jgi:hypothetical protein
MNGQKDYQQCYENYSIRPKTKILYTVTKKDTASLLYISMAYMHMYIFLSINVFMLISAYVFMYMYSYTYDVIK